MKETEGEKREKSTRKSVDGDDGGQGKLYSPEFAVKINTREQQEAHKQETEDQMGQKINKEASGGKEEKPAKKTIASKL